MTRYGMVFDRKKCITCNACTMACKMTNNTPSGVFRTKVLTEEAGSFPTASLVITPHVCMHCGNPTCVHVCPTGASQKSEEGIVWVDKSKCIGCRFCAIACPYGARTFVEKIDAAFEGKEMTPFETSHEGIQKEGTVDKCDFCRNRLTQDKKPACVCACPVDARVFGDLDDPKSEIAAYLGDHDAYRMYEELDFAPQFYFCDK